MRIRIIQTGAVYYTKDTNSLRIPIRFIIYSSSLELRKNVESLIGDVIYDVYSFESETWNLKDIEFNTIESGSSEAFIIDKLLEGLWEFRRNSVSEYFVGRLTGQIYDICIHEIDDDPPPITDADIICFEGHI